VAGDAFAVTGIAGPYVVSGTLHLPNGPGVLLGAEVQASTVVREPVVVSPPCPCGPQPPLGPPAPVTPLFDIGAAVDERSARNANTTIPFADAFAGEIDEIQTFDWPCGEFYLPGIRTGAQAALEFRVHGRTGIFVDGDVYLGNSLTVTLDPGAELDLVVAGSLISNGRLLGAPSSPARVRLWIGSTTLSLSDQILVGAVVYAPLATLVIGFMASLNGSVLVSNVNDNGNGLHLFYDPAAASAGMSCGISPMPEVE
jgi:hypothetical protein